MSEARTHLDDVIGDIADSYISDPDTRRSMIQDLREAISATLDEPTAIDWPARFKIAAEVADNDGWTGIATMFRALAHRATAGHIRPHVVEAIGRALQGERGHDCTSGHPAGCVHVDNPHAPIRADDEATDPNLRDVRGPMGLDDWDEES